MEIYISSSVLLNISRVSMSCSWSQTLVKNYHNFAVFFSGGNLNKALHSMYSNIYLGPPIKWDIACKKTMRMLEIAQKLSLDLSLLWIGGSNGIGFEEFIYKSIVPATFMAPMKSTFNLADAQTILVGIASVLSSTWRFSFSCHANFLHHSINICGNSFP